jgi:hypothetical protein
MVYFIAIWYILLPFGIFYCHLVYFIAIWYILLPFGIFCGDLGIFYYHLVYFMAIWYILRSFWYTFPVLVCCAKKNLATLIEARQ